MAQSPNGRPGSSRQGGSSKGYSNGRSSQRGMATRRVSQVSRSRRRSDNRIMIMLIISVVAVFSTVLIINIIGAKNTLEELKQEKVRLEVELKKQEDLASRLEEKAVYVKTNAYIEEQARKMGLVYPDEVIFKPEE